MLKRKFALVYCFTDITVMDILDEADDCLRLSHESVRLCSACAVRGKRRRITALQLNFNEAVYMCSEPEVGLTCNMCEI